MDVTSGGFISRWKAVIWPGAVFFLTTLFYVVAFPAWDVAEAAYVFAIPAILWIWRGAPWRLFVGVMLASGFLSWILLIVWLHHVTAAGMVVAAFLLSLFGTAWFCAAWWMLPHVRERRFLGRMLGFVGLACLWVVLEYLRGFVLSGFPWLTLSASQWQRPLLLQTAAWTGAWGVSFILIFFNLGVASYIDRLYRLYGKNWMERFTPEFFLALILLLFGSFGLYSSAKVFEQEREHLFEAALVQPNVAQHMKWDAEYSRFVLDRIERNTLLMTAFSPDLVVWPEAVTPFPVLGDENVRRWAESITEALGAPLLMGSIAVEAEGTPEERWHNGVFIITPEEGLQRDYYRKRKLVPFGEYVPLERYMPFISKAVPLDGRFFPGRSPDPLTLAVNGRAIEAGILICYEDIFPHLARHTVLRGTDVLFVLTNNAWYGERAAAYQHAAHSVLRAVETRRPVVRSGNAGWSGWIDEYGHIRDVLVDQRGSIYFTGGMPVEVSRDLAWKDRNSFYVEHGDWFPLLSFGICVLAAAVFVPARLRGQRW